MRHLSRSLAFPATRLGRSARLALAAAAVVSLALVAARDARACSGSIFHVPPTATPRPGATGVSTATSLFVLSAADPSPLTLTAGGVSIPLSAPEPLALGADGVGNGITSFWRVRRLTEDFLPPSAELVLSQGGGDGGPPTTLTTFTTAAGYDKTPGAAAVLRGITLKRVRYPVDEIGAGGCVSMEYYGLIGLDYDPATAPDTPPASIVNVITLAPKTGGRSQSFLFTGGPNVYKGSWPATSYRPPPSDNWPLELDPSRDYCATIASFAFGDLARPPMVSASVCASVDEIDLDVPDAAAPVVDAGLLPGHKIDASGCSVGGANPRSTFWSFALLGLLTLVARRHFKPRG
jgi:MYXO-CTERM domain-containing protein